MIFFLFNVVFFKKKIKNFFNQWMPYIILIFKTLFICIFAIAVRGTLPRYRFDQATQLNWKHFIYIWFVFILINLSYLIIFF